jgi:hypothetical protein
MYLHIKPYTTTAVQLQRAGASLLLLSKKTPKISDRWVAKLPNKTTETLLECVYVTNRRLYFAVQ